MTIASPPGAFRPEALPAASAASASPPGAQGADLSALVMSLTVEVQVVLGNASLTVAELSRLAVDSVIELDRRIGEMVDVLVNGRHVARGEIVVLDKENGRLGVRVVEILPGALASLPA